jgi:hypothetical protein
LRLFAQLPSPVMVTGLHPSDPASFRLTGPPLPFFPFSPYFY